MTQFMTRENCRYWGWGTLDQGYDAAKTEKFIGILESLYGMTRLKEPQKPSPLNAFRLPASRLKRNFISKWKSRGLSVDKWDRITHAAGKSYRDLLRVRSATLNSYPDGVLYLQKATDLASLYEDASRDGLALIPFGGGTGVVGGTECIGGERPVLVIDTKHLDRMTDFDAVSMTASFEAGILGPELERLLNGKGVTLGHFPQSFEFSTLGGWIVTRSAGQHSTKYGKIENMTQSVTLHSPSGSLMTHGVPASATGPSIREMLVGSEGLYGIVTEATVRVVRQPQSRKWVAAFFPDFTVGVEAMRELLQTDIRPSVLRLLDAEETRLFSAFSLKGSFMETIAETWKKWHGLGDEPSFLLTAVEGDQGAVEFEYGELRRVVKKRGGKILGIDLRKKWEGEKFRLPYLRDELMNHGYFIDTLETVASWSRLEDIHQRVRDAISGERFGKIAVGTHLSHAYRDGASLYFTFIGEQDRGNGLEQWEALKSAATEALLKAGGALSHHHGIGYDHRRWMKDECGQTGLKILTDLKKSFDPEGLLNPGKLL